MIRHVHNLWRGTKFFVSDHITPEINDRHRELQRINKQKRAEGRHVKLVADHMYIDS